MRGKEMSEAAAAADQMEPATKAKAGAAIAAFYATECQAVNASSSSISRTHTSIFLSLSASSLLLSYLLLTHRQRTAGRAGRTTPNTRPFKSVSFVLLLELENLFTHSSHHVTLTRRSHIFYTNHFTYSISH
jgi:hypothetical protein